MREAAFGLLCTSCQGPEGTAEVRLPNPGFDDGMVPKLNPIDPGLSNPIGGIFAENLDLFIEHGSGQEGSAP